jgi:hypothetical protein
MPCFNEFLFYSPSGMALMLWACSENPSTPDLTQSEQESGVAALAKRGSTRFAAEVDFSGPIANLATCLSRTPNSLQFNGCELNGPVRGDLAGTAVAFFTGFQTPITSNLSGDGKAGGPLTLTVTWRGISGTFEGSFKGKWRAGVFTGKAKARGAGGFEGMKLRANVQEQGASPGTSVFTITGRIEKGENGDDDDDDDDDEEDDGKRKHGGN